MRLLLGLSLFLLSIVLPAKALSDDYSSEWKAVDEHLENQRPKSALEIVQKIYDKAIANHNEQQIIKSASYRIGLTARQEENSEIILVSELKQEISHTTSPLSRSLFE
ncbi:MAG: hypothetical protein HYZ54_11455, partial [Ignavibacteriae bacterium]|nr:hypothetical protein [Ignavibacteriota bacterium]